MADTREDSSEDSSDSTSSDNFSIYTETSSSEEDLQNLEEPGTSTSSATTHNSHREIEIIFETADCEKVQATTVIFRGKSLSKNKLTCKNAVARIYGSCTLRVMGSWFNLSIIFFIILVRFLAAKSPLQVVKWQGYWHLLILFGN